MNDGINTENRFEMSEMLSPGLSSPRMSDPLDQALEENLLSSPLGRLLGVISQLPEIRYEKVERVRDQIRTGAYDLKDHLDAALDRVLDEIIVEG